MTNFSKKTSGLLLLLSFIGLGLSGWLTYLHVRVYSDPSYESVCAISTKVNCETVAMSRYSIFLGMPISVWGAVAYLGLGFLSIVQLRRKKDDTGTIGLICLMGVAMVAGSVVLAYISTAVIGALCIYCTATYLVNLAVLVIAIVELRRAGSIVTAVLGELKYWGGRRSVAIQAIVVPLILIAGLIFCIPSYWNMASWRDGPSLPHGFDEQGHPWLGAEEPEVTVYEYLDYECPHCRLGHNKLRRILMKHSKQLRIVRYDFARMPCKADTPAQNEVLCTVARAAYCAGQQGQFWQWNDMVMAAPKQSVNRGHYEKTTAQRLGLDMKAFDECLTAPATVGFAHNIFMRAVQNKVKETPVYMVKGKKVLLADIEAML